MTPEHFRPAPPAPNSAVTPTAHPASLVPFNLSRWFALAALSAIAALSIGLGVLLNHFLTERLLWQEAVLTSEFAQNLVRTEKSLQAFFADPSRGLDAEIEAAFSEIAALRANVYDPSRRVVWSSDRQLIGQTFGPNDELDRALEGHIVSHSEDAPPAETHKTEHRDLRRQGSMFVEIYVPVTDSRGERVRGVIEFYKNPRALVAALRQLRLYIALGAGFSGALLFFALFGLVRRADCTIRNQQRQLVENETLAVIGEMSAAVAHGIRNPLASIRSSAELIRGGDLAEAHDAAADIMAQSDRLEAWVRELLAYARPLDEAIAAVPLQPVVSRCMEAFEREMQRRNIRTETALAADLPAVRGDTLLLGQVLSSLLSNAIEALDQNGHITVRGEWDRSQTQVTLSVEDSGPGMTSAQLGRVGKPFHTTKARGLGVGLALARRVIERFGGRLEIASYPGRGTTVRLHLRAA